MGWNWIGCETLTSSRGLRKKGSQRQARTLLGASHSGKGWNYPPSPRGVGKAGDVCFPACAWNCSHLPALWCSSFRRESGTLQHPVPWLPVEKKQVLCKCAPLEAVMGSDQLNAEVHAETVIQIACGEQCGWGWKVLRKLKLLSPDYLWAQDAGIHQQVSL